MGKSFCTGRGSSGVPSCTPHQRGRRAVAIDAPSTWAHFPCCGYPMMAPLLSQAVIPKAVEHALSELSSFALAQVGVSRPSAGLVETIQ
jgi:hypothetical protein